MIRIRGGIAKLQNSLLRQTLILLVPPPWISLLRLNKFRTDYELACFFQQDLYLLQPYERYSPAISASYPESYSSPLAESITTFRDIYERLDLHPLAASILDEIRSLTMSIYLLSTAEKNSSHSDKNSSFKYIHSTASRIHEDICSLPILPILTSSPTNNIIYEVIRLTALAYASCISTRTPFNLAYTPSVRKEVYSKIDLVRLNTWKRIPGIFLWILLVACPGSRYHAPLLIRSNVSATALYISFTDFGLAVGCLRAFWRVQRMIMSVKEENDEQIAEE
jgi:hypothetical protein